jgi:hypothetical protein
MNASEPDIREVIIGLRRRMNGSLVVDPELRQRIIEQYEGGTLEGIPPDAQITIDFEAPRSADTLHRDLNRLERIASERWGTTLPRDFRRVYEEHGRIVLSIRWLEDGHQEGAGCQWMWPGASLKSHWVAEPRYIEHVPTRGTHEVFVPMIPFIGGNESEPVALVFKHVPARNRPTVEWITPDCFEDQATSSREPTVLAFKHPRDIESFSMWLARWIEAGLSPTGSVDPMSD